MPTTEQQYFQDKYGGQANANALGANPGAELISSLNSNPIGTLQGEASLQVPFNAVARRPNVYIINHSRTKARKVCKVSVSPFSGAEEAMRYSKEYAKAYGNVSVIYAEAKRRDMSIYEEEIKPATFLVQFDGQKFYIPPASEDDPHNPPVEMVPEGVWDLYLGNFERMHPAVDTADARREKNEETARLALNWQGRHNPVWRVTVDGVEERRQDNPFGFIEIVREIPKTAPQRVDSSFVTASELIEE